jgi:ATP-dependent Clp protease ATP-binding subunit ClpX
MNDTSVASPPLLSVNASEFVDIRFQNDLTDDFPRNIFLDLLRKSLSLSLHDKIKILIAVPRLSSTQLYDLLDTFNQEQSLYEKSIKQDASESYLAEKSQKAELEWPEVVRRWMVFTKHPPQAIFDVHDLLTPQALHLLLDSHVIGQSHVTKELATLVYHQMLASHLISESAPPIPKVTRPVLLAGYTGTGKTFTIQKICELTNLPFVHVNTASMVEEGIVGTSLNDIGKEILRKADNDVNRAEYAIVFLDEFDKTMSGSVYGNSVTNQLLRIIEGSELKLHAGRWDDSDSKPIVSSLRTNSMLFILGGAFQNLLESKNKLGIGFGKTASNTPPKLTENDLVKLGFPKELAGRINTILTLTALDEDDYYVILTEGGSSPLKDYLQLVQGYGDEVHIPEDALREISRQAVETGLGTRALHKIVHGVFKDILYESPNPIVQTFVITREKVLDVVEGVCS